MKQQIVGKLPLIIVSQDDEDALYLSLLLSNHLEPANSFSGLNFISASENYFFNSSTNAWLERLVEDPYSDALADRLALVMEEGFDTGRLYGMSIPLQFFSSSLLHHACLQDARFIFLYNELAPIDLKTSSSLNEWISTLETDPEHFLCINAKTLVSSPKRLVQAVSEWVGTNIKEAHRITPRSMFNDAYWGLSNQKKISKEVLSLLASHVLPSELDSKYRQEGLQVIFYGITIGSLSSLNNRLKELICQFIHPPHVVVLCDHHQTVEKLDKDLTQLKFFFSGFTCQLEEASLAQHLNNIIRSSQTHYFLIDDLSFSFSYDELLMGKYIQEARLAYATLLRHEDVMLVGMPEILVKEYPKGNLLSDRSSFDQFNGFAMDVHRTYLFWDFVVRALAQSNDKVRAVPAVFNPFTTTVSQSGETTSGYEIFLSKHHALLSTHLDEVDELTNNERFLSQQENLLLNQKLAGLQMLSMHAKEELSALQQLNAQLHQRIHFLENNWYIKLKNKLKRYARIFFKKKSPGTGNLKRILQFLRFAFSKAGFGLVRKVLAGLLRRIYLWTEPRDVEIRIKGQANPQGIFTYHDWIKIKLELAAKEADKYAARLGDFQPLISIIMPVYNTPLKFLREAIESVLSQSYSNWELSIADDCSTNLKIRKVLHVYSVKDKRIKVHYRTENGHISRTSNDALAMTQGEFVLLMDHDDLLSVNCLLEVVKAIQKHPDADLIYSDEDKIDEAGFHQQAHFKPDWAPDHLLSRNYIGHVAVIRRSLMETCGGFREGYEGSQDYDLLLRVSEISSKIVHIAKVLYHWRIHRLSAAQGEEVKPYAYIAAKKALEEALCRRGLRGQVRYLPGLRGYRIDYDLKHTEKISILIPTKDQVALLTNTVDSIISKTSYTEYEIIILNNNSTSESFDEWRKEYTTKHANLLTVVDAHFPFNFSRLMNLGAQYATGTQLLMLNNDVEVIHDDWLSTMLSYAQQQRIGAVGVRLLFPDDTIQHAGVIVGLGGIAGHSFVGAHKEEAGYFNYIQSVNNYSAVTAACLMCRKAVFEEVGGMDELFAVEYNDVDFCLKLRQAGYYNVYLPQVELYHYESATRGHPHQSKPSYERHVREMKMFKDKWQSVIDHDPFYNPNLNLGAHDFSMNFSA